MCHDREDLDINQVWARIKAAYDSHDLVITIGSGSISPEEERATGLIGEHDYAIQGLKEDENGRFLLVKNPWCSGPAWTGGWQSTPLEPSRGLQTPQTTPGPDTGDGLQTPGPRWVTLADVAQNFESMYLNWNPDLFAHRQDLHFAWDLPPAHLAPTLAGNPQFSIVSATGGPAWILISRHFQDAELEIAKRRTDSMAAIARQLGFMSILVFDAGGKRVQVSGGETYRGPYVDSPQTLARLSTTAGKRYTVVLDQHEFPLNRYTFTLAAFSHSPLQVEDAAEPMSHSKEELSSWSRRTAGGNGACSTFFTNPQYRLSVPESTPLSILLSTASRDVHIHVDLAWGHGKRVAKMRVKDLVASSGEYRRGCAVASIPQLDAGVYTIVCSTFEAGQLASFGLRVTSMVPVTLDPVPADAAGRLITPLPPFTLAEGVEGFRAPLDVSWLTRASVSVHTKNASRGRNGTTLIRLSIVHGRGPNQMPVVMSEDGEFQDPSTALRTPEFDIEPDRTRGGGIWLVVEAMGQRGDQDGLEGEVFSDSPVHVGAWESL